MSEIDGLSGKPMTEDIGGVPITLVPLTLRDLSIVLKAGSTDVKEMTAGVMEMVDKTLKNSYPEEKDPLSKISLVHMNALITLVMKVNGMSVENVPLPKGNKEGS